MNQTLTGNVLHLISHQQTRLTVTILQACSVTLAAWPNYQQLVTKLGTPVAA